MQASERIEILERLGLTEYEARTISVLFVSNDINAQQLSRESQVPKTRVYDVLERLLDRKLIIEINGRPKRYRTMSSTEVIDRLISLKKEQVNLLEKESDYLRESFLENGDASESGEKVLKVRNQKDFDLILAQELGKATKSIQGLTEIQEDNHFIHSALAKAKDKDVTIRILNSLPTQKLKKVADVKHFNHGLNAFIIY